MYALTLTSPPAGEPLSLAEAKAHCRVDVSDDDAYLLSLVTAAREHIEDEIGRQLVSATWRMDCDHFPDSFLAMGDWRGQPLGRWRSVAANLLWPDYATIRVPKGPLQSVVSITYTDANGATQTVDSSTYKVKLSDPGVIAPAFGHFWPPTRCEVAAISVTFAAGYGPVTTVAAAIGAGTQTVTPASMQGVYVGTVLTLDPGFATREQVVVSAVTATTFTATFRQSHTAGCVINCIPEKLRTACRLLVGHWYENREAVADAALKPVPLAYESLLMGNWNGSYQ